MTWQEHAVKCMTIKKIINLLHNTGTQLSKLGTKNLVEINDDVCETFKINSQVKSKTVMVKSSLWDHIHLSYTQTWTCKMYINLQGYCSIIVTEAGTDAAVRQPDRNNKQVIFKNYASFTNCLSWINNIKR